MSDVKVRVKLLNPGGYKDWKNMPKFPVVVEAVRHLRGYTVLAAEMLRIGYAYPSTRYFYASEVEVFAHTPKASENELEAPLNKVRTPKHRNPQAIRWISQLGGGVFRINGLYKGKARLCKVEVLGKTVLFTPMDSRLPYKELDKEDLQKYLHTRELSIMCVERF